MKKPLKIILWIISVLSLVSTLAIAGISFLFNVNDFKPQIAGMVKQQTGRTLDIPGDFRLSLFPAPGVTTGKMLLHNPAYFSEQIFAEIASAEIRLRWLPLLTNKIELGKVVLHGLSLNLIKNSQGQTSWEGLLKPTQPSSASRVSPLRAQMFIQPDINTFSVKHLSLEQGHVLWDDQQAGRKIVLDNLQLQAKQVALEQPIPLTLSFEVNARQYALNLDTQLYLDKHLDTFKLNGLSMQVQAVDSAIPGGRLTMTGILNSLEYIHSQQALKLTDIQLNSHNLQLKAQMTANQVLDKPEVQGTLQVAPVNIREYLQQQGIAAPAMQDTTALSHFQADIHWQATDHSVTLSQLNAKLDQTTLQGTIACENFKQPSITLSAELDTLDVDRYFASNAQAPTPMLSSALIFAATQQALQPIEYLKQLSLEGKLLIHQLKMHNLDMQEVNLNLQDKAGKLQSQQSIQQLYQGAYQGNASVSLVNNLPYVSVNEAFQHMDLEPFLVALNQEPKLTGTADLNAQLQGQGDSIPALTSSLAGNIQVQVENGSIKGFQLPKGLNDIKALLSGQSDNSAQTTFKAITGTGQITQGIIDNHDLLMVTSEATVNGKGSVNLNTAQMAYQLKVQLADTAIPIKALRNNSLLLALGGTLDAPTVSVEGIVSDKPSTGSQETNLIKKLDDTLQKKLGIDTSELLKKLF